MTLHNILTREYCSFFLLSLLLMLLHHSAIDRKIKFHFYQLIMLFVLYLVLDFFSLYTDTVPNSESVHTVICYIKYAVKPALLYYVLLVLERDSPPRKRRLLGLPLLIESLILIISFPFGWIAYFIPPNNHFCSGPLIPVTWIILLIYMALIIQSAVSSHCTSKERFFLLFGESFICLNIINERLFTTVPGMEHTVIIFAILIYYLYFTSFFETEYRIHKEKELNRAKTQAMISQIKPHFIYNSLACIAELCHDGSPQGEAAILTFSAYLRNCFQSLTDEGLIPFENELRTIKYYIELEKMQDPEKFKVLYDIREKNFHVPILSVETIVENAVKHGIRKKHGSGTITIRTARNNNGIIITISDDGLGFSIDSTPRDDSHLGFENAKKRFEAQCGATTRITSIPGEGTTVTIIIPEESL